MSRFVSWFPVVLVALCTGLVLAGAPARGAALAQDAEAHKTWMNEASDAQEDYRFGLAEKNTKAVADALASLERLMGQTESYWAARKAADGVRLSKDARAFAAQALAAHKAGDSAATAAAFEKLSSACNACHDLQLEKR